MRDPSGRLLFRYDPGRRLVEVRLKRITTLVDLTQYENRDKLDDR